MPEINPLTNNQIFLKKIAENTGSDYETGDVSEINPLTIDQIFLKEIAANTEGQSGDITELEEKVTANAEAIEELTERVEVKLLSNERLIIEKCGRVVHVSTFRHLAVDDVSSAIIPSEYRPKNDIYGAIGLYDGSTGNYSACTGVVRAAGNIQAVTPSGGFYSGSDYQIVFSFTYIV